MSVCKKCLLGEAHKFAHGLSAYTYHRCRCDICKAAASEYAKHYYEHHSEQIIEYQRRYREEHAEELQDWREQNRERERERQQRWRDDNRERERERLRRYNEENFEHIAERKRRWAEQHPGYKAEQYSRNPQLYRDNAAAQYGRNPQYYRRRIARWSAKKARIPAPRNGQPWTPVEDAAVMRNDISITRICYKLGRSYHAVAGRRRKLRGCPSADTSSPPGRAA